MLSDATLRNFDEADPDLRDGLRHRGTHWDRIEVWSVGQRHEFSGNGMAAIRRRVLLQELQRNAEAAGARLRSGAKAPSLAVLRQQYDVLVGADGASSSTRQHVEESGADLGHAVAGPSTGTSQLTPTRLAMT